MKSMSKLMTLFIVAALWLMPQLVAADGPLTVSFDAAGGYGVAVKGVGLTNAPSGTITLNVPGTPVKATLYWAGYDLIDGGDNTIVLAIDGGAATELTADTQLGPDLWLDRAGTINDMYHFVYIKDVTSLVQPGTHTYAVSGVELDKVYGASIQVIYEDASLPTRAVKALEGLDSAYWNFPPPRGPNTEVAVITFDAASFDRTLDFAITAGGVDDSRHRGTALWFQAGSGAPPTDIVGTGTQIADDPFENYDGAEWDTYTGSVTIPAGSTYAAFQIESQPNDPPQDVDPVGGASLLWIAMASQLDLPASLGDYVWEDANQNGIQDAGEAGIPGVTVNLYDCDGNWLASATTDGSGYYLFDNLAPGCYSVEFVAPSGYQFTTPNQGGDDALDSDADPTTGKTGNINLASGQSDLTWDAGLYRMALGGCTYTQGYWKTHSSYGPAPYDATWALVGEDTPFFDTGKSWYEVMWTKPKHGNAYYILAHQYIAAYLNQLNGADTSALGSALTDAAALLDQYDGNPEPMSAITGAVRDQFTSLAETLDRYNNGETGPGHCDGDQTR